MGRGVPCQRAGAALGLHNYFILRHHARLFFYCLKFARLWVNMITQKLIQKNKKRLLEEKDRLVRLLSGVASRNVAHGDFHPKYPEFGNKEDENAAEVTQFATNIAEERDLVERLKKVEAALERIKDGRYGKCLNGGEEMSVARLEAVPEAESCVKHAR